MSQEEYTQFIELYRKFNKKLDYICHIGFDKDLSYFDSAVINDQVIDVRIEHNKQTKFIKISTRTKRKQHQLHQAICKSLLNKENE